MTCTCDQLAIEIIGSHNTLLGFDLLTRTHRIQRNTLLARLLVYYKRIELRNGQAEEMPKQGLGKGSRAPMPCPEVQLMLFEWSCVHQLRNSLNPVFLFLWWLHFMGKMDEIIVTGHWADLQSLSLLLRSGGEAEHSNPLIIRLVLQSTSLHP